MRRTDVKRVSFADADPRLHVALLQKGPRLAPAAIDSNRRDAHGDVVEFDLDDFFIVECLEEYGPNVYFLEKKIRKTDQSMESSSVGFSDEPSDRGKSGELQPVFALNGLEYANLDMIHIS